MESGRPLSIADAHILFLLHDARWKCTRKEKHAREEPHPAAGCSHRRCCKGVSPSLAGDVFRTRLVGRLLKQARAYRRETGEGERRSSQAARLGHICTERMREGERKEEDKGEGRQQLRPSLARRSRDDGVLQELDRRRLRKARAHGATSLVPPHPLLLTPRRRHEVWADLSYSPAALRETRRRTHDDRATMNAATPATPHTTDRLPRAQSLRAPAN